MRITEIFYSLQGEGYRVGEASVFVRLSGCDLACGFCDTEFASGKDMSAPDLADWIARKWPTAKWIVWTGGEPTLQLDPGTIKLFKDRGYLQAIETNGNNPVPDGIDWVACSPKVAEHVLKKNFPRGVDELRYVRHSGQPGVPQPSIDARHHFLSPMFNGDRVDPENLRHCINLCLENPKWRLSVQTHKLTRIL